MHRNRVDPGVGEQQHAQAIGEPVLGDAFDRCDFLRQPGGKRREGRKKQKSRGKEPFQKG